SSAPVAAPPGPLRPPRDLTPLTRHRQSADGATAAAAPAPGATAGGPLQFELAPCAGGIHVLRVHRRDDGARVYCSVLFDDERTFHDWLDSDPMRFSHPLAFQQARRCFAQLMAQRQP